MSEVFEGVIGIDLGTTYCCVAVFLDNAVQVIPNSQGNRTTPSRVALQVGADGKPQTIVGDAAMNISARGNKNVLYDAKRVIGRRFDDKAVQADAAHWPFSIEENPRTGGVVLVAQHQEEVRRYEPEEVSALVLAYLKECAERYLGKKVTKAVVTVPAYFNDAQRQSTKAAGTIAGLEVLRIINEPTAAALAYGIGSPQAPQSTAVNVLVFDFGGGTFDVSVITIDNGAFEVRATAGDTHLGGQDIDSALVQHVTAEAARRFGKDLSENSRHVAKLRLLCERTKRALSSSSDETVLLDDFFGDDGDERSVAISRAKFDALNAALYQRCLDIVARALKDAKMDRRDIAEVILVGGSSRIPKLQAMLSQQFDGKALCHAVSPDEAVAVGAAIQGSILSADPAQQSAQTACLLLMDVVSLSIGVDVDGGKFDVLIPRNTAIPYSTTREFTTMYAQQDHVDIAVYEGERPLVKHNHLLAGFRLDAITKAKKGAVAIVITFSVDENGILSVCAEERRKDGNAGARKALVVESSDRLSDAEVQRMVERAEAARVADDKEAGVQAVVASLRSLTGDVATAAAAFLRLTQPDFAPTAAADDPRGLLGEQAAACQKDKVAARLKGLEAPLTWLFERAEEAADAEAITPKAEKLRVLLEKTLAAVIKATRKAAEKKAKKNKNAHKRRRDDDDDDDEYDAEEGSGGDDASDAESDGSSGGSDTV